MAVVVEWKSASIIIRRIAPQVCDNITTQCIYKCKYIIIIICDNTSYIE